MQQIADWLKQVGMQEYIRRFAENDIDFAILSDLTDRDLEKIGITSLGHRRKLLRAIAELRGVEKSGPAVATGVAQPATSRAADSAERRQVTVLFSDLVGSTALSARMDPEDLREIISAYQKCVAEVARRFGGFVAKYMGDGVLIYFGYPQAHEDDAERAVHTGLAVIDAVNRLPQNLAVRIGIATGLVVVGDLIGTGAAQEFGIVGETPNLAARLQTVAIPNSLVIADSTRHQIGRLFKIEDLGRQTLAGFTDPQRAWRVLAESDEHSRFKALRSGTTPLVGRDEDLEILLHRWARARAGKGQVALISGEPGIGKSRLLAALQERVRHEPHTRLRYFCSPQYTDTALHPIIGQLEHAAGFERDEPHSSKLDKLEKLLLVATPLEDRALIAELLSLAREGQRFPTLELTPQIRKERTLQTLLRQLEKLAEQRPVLMLFEDAHWSDPTSLELLDRIVEQVHGLPVLLLLTFRPEFIAPWISQPHVMTTTLRHLDARESAILVGHLVEDPTFKANLLEEIINRADGVPLFLEEMTKAVVETGAGEAQGNLTARPPSVTAIPATLLASLTARLDRLGLAKDVAQIGAVVGREFSYELLRELTPFPESNLRSALDGLVASELVMRRGTVPAASYVFKHALVRQAAYEMLLRNKRRKLHGRIADLIEQKPEISERQPEILAQHYAEAGLNEKAVDYWIQAGKRSIARSAMGEAERQFEKALARVLILPNTRQRAFQELEIQSGLGSVRLAISGFAAPHVAQTYARARELWEQLGYPPEFLRVPWGQVMYHVNRGDLARTRDLSENLMELAEQQHDASAFLPARLCMGGVNLCFGDFPESRLHLDEAHRFYAPALRNALIQPLGIDPHVMVLGFLSLVLFFLGYLDQALARSKEAIAEAREGSHRPSLAAALSIRSRLLACLPDDRLLAESANALVDIAIEQGFPYWRAQGAIYQGWCMVRNGENEAGLAQLRRGATAFRATGAELWTPIHYALEAQAEAVLGNVDVALTIIDDALLSSRARNENWFEVELVRMRGELLRTRDPVMAETAFREAIEIAVRQKAKLCELRATTSLARLWVDTGRSINARKLLASVYDWFTEGFNSPDLKAAKALLDA